MRREWKRLQIIGLPRSGTSWWRTTLHNNFALPAGAAGKHHLPNHPAASVDRHTDAHVEECAPGAPDYTFIEKLMDMGALCIAIRKPFPLWRTSINRMAHDPQVEANYLTALYAYVGGHKGAIEDEHVPAAQALHARYYAAWATFHECVTVVEYLDCLRDPCGQLELLRKRHQLPVKAGLTEGGGVWKLGNTWQPGSPLYERYFPNKEANDGKADLPRNP